jgi:SAM-dependent methyltransferase
MDDAMTLEIDPGNAGQLRDWDGAHGAYWAEKHAVYDACMTRYQPTLLAAVGARPGERILDVGCGVGQVAVDLVRGTPGSTAVGVDLSSAQLEVARRRAGDLAVEFVQADAQVHDFGEGAFDVVVSRTGTMFFSDRDRAFANLARSTKPGGRLAMLVWREMEANPWLRDIFGAIAAVRPMPAPPAGAPGPFALSDADYVRSLLTGAAWGEVGLDALDEQLWFGPDADGATDFMVGQMDWLFAKLDDDQKRQARANLRAVMARSLGAEGVLLSSGAWLVTARRV